MTAAHGRDVDPGRVADHDCKPFAQGAERMTDHKHITGGVEEDRLVLRMHLSRDHRINPDPLANPAEWHRAAHRASDVEDALRDALRVHHPIMRSETGPFSGCRCGQVRLGQDVIAHVVEHLRVALGEADR